MAEDERSLVRKEDRQARIGELEERLRKAEQERKKEEQERKKEVRLRLGCYYSTFTEVWKPCPNNYSDEHYTAMFRDKPPDFLSRDGSKPRVYFLTWKHACDSNNNVKDDADSARTSHSKQKDKERIWPCHVLETEMETLDDPQTSQDDLSTPSAGVLMNVRDAYKHKKIPGFTAPDEEYVRPSNVRDSDDNEVEEWKSDIYGDIAHLLPASPLHASLHFDVAKWVFGLRQDTTSNVEPVLVQKLIHGCAIPGRRRIDHTGLKHMTSNKIRLKGQRLWYDEKPCLLIVPILTLEKAKSWNGEGYEAVFLIAGGSSRYEIKQRKNAAADVGLSLDEMDPNDENNLFVASLEELEVARGMLSATLLGLAQSLSKTVRAPPSFLTAKHREKLKEFENCTAILNGKHQVKVPEPMEPGETTENKPIRKIFFSSNHSEFGHPAPDPILLAVKAASVWSRFHSDQLIASGFVEDEDSEGSLQAEREFLEWRDSKLKEQRDNDIIGMAV